MPNQQNEISALRYVKYFFYTLISALLLFICNYVSKLKKHSLMIEKNTQYDIQILTDLLDFEKEHAELEFQKMKQIEKLEELELDELDRLKKKD